MASKRGKIDIAAAPEVGERPREDVMEGVVRPPEALTRGPRKKRKSGPRPPRLSNHKVRSQWFRSRAAYPVREAPVQNLVEERKRAAKLPVAKEAQWTSVGPTNIGGRATSIVCDPNDPDRIWLGAAGGGVWHSTDGGKTWTAQWHDQDVLNIGSLAIDPRNPNILYCGTGEANLSSDSYGGVGIYRTKDGGKKWTLLASCENKGIPSRIGVIAIDPFDSDHILIGGVGHAEVGAGGLEDLGGLYLSKNGGKSWMREEFVSTRNYWCHSIVFDPNAKGTIYATFTEQGTRSGIYRSLNGGRKWEQLTKGLPAPERMGRTSLALAPSNTRIIYAQASDEHSTGADHVLGIFRSANGGDSWTEIGGLHFRNEDQMSYGNAIAVHPERPNYVICGGVDLHLTTNGGRDWQRVTDWDAKHTHFDYAHADHHALLMPASRPGWIYDANDGGLDVSADGGLHWKNRSAGLAITMFYDADMSASDSRAYGGGAQDNGTVITRTGEANTFEEILGGDGGWIVWDPNDVRHFYASWQNFHIHRFKNGRSRNVSPRAPVSERDQVWMCFIAIDHNDPDTVFTGSYRVWRTRNDGMKWVPVSPILDEALISAIEIAPKDSLRIYVGTENGGIFRSNDRGETWSANIAGSMLPGYLITRIETSPVDADVVYVTLANFDESHVFRSRDGGATWEDIDREQLPTVPHHSVCAVRRKGVEEVYVANDAGVYMTEDGGAHWRNVSGNLPNVMVVDLVHHDKEDALIAATYGRSIWRLQL